MSEVDLTLLLVASVGALALSPYVLAFIGARTRRAKLSSGDTDQTADAVSAAMKGAGRPSSFRAFALASLGEFAAARRALLAAPRTADEHSEDLALCTEVLVAALEGEWDLALELAVELVQLPVFGDEERQRARRLGVVSVLRLMSGVTEEEDWLQLETAVTHEPVMLWPVRYAGALRLAAIGRWDLVERLLNAAPEWPSTSHFAQLHAHLMAASLRGARSGRYGKDVAA